MIDNYTIVIGVTGKMMSGKDAVSDALTIRISRLGGSSLIFQLSNYMKKVVQGLWGADTWSTAGKASTIAPDLTGREALQKISSFFRGLDEMVWLRALEQDIRDSHPYRPKVAIISDIRLPFEAAFCDYVIRVDRPGGPTSTDNEQKHETETGVDHIIPDHIIVNDGTLEDLNEAVNKIMIPKLT